MFNGNFLSSFKGYFKKELLEARKQYKFLILPLGFLFFAFLDPVMLKLLPKIIGGASGAMLETLIKADQSTAIRNYIKDIFQIGLIIIGFMLSSTLCDEIKEKRMMFPISKGLDKTGALLSKFTFFTILIASITLVSFLVNYYYSAMIFEAFDITITQLLASALLFFVYIFWFISLSFFVSSFSKKGLYGGFIALGINYLLIIGNSIDNIKKFLPYNLVTEANSFTLYSSSSTIVAVLGYSIVLLALSIYIFNKRENI